MSPHTAASTYPTSLKGLRTFAVVGLSLLSVGHFIFGTLLCVLGAFGVALTSTPLTDLVPGAIVGGGALYGVITGLGVATFALFPVLVMSAAMLGKRGRFHFVVGALIITTLVDAPFILMHIINLDVVSFALMAVPLTSAAYVAWRAEREHRLAADWH